MGGVAWTLLCVTALVALVLTTVTRSKRKYKRNSDDSDYLVTSSSGSDDAVSDDVEAGARSKPKREKEVVESSKSTDKRRSGASSGPHVCRFCGQQFAQSQALGGHMNKHRSEKEQEAFTKAQTLVAQRSYRFPVSHSLQQYNMQGGGGGGGGGGSLNYDQYMDSSPPIGQHYGPTQSSAVLHNPSTPRNQGYAALQQNAQNPMDILHQGVGPPAGTYYPSTDNTRQYSYGIPARRAPNLAQQFYTTNNVGINSGQTGYVDSTSMTHTEVDPFGQARPFHSNIQGGTSTASHVVDFSKYNSTNMVLSNNHQVQSSIAMPSESYVLQKSAEHQQINSSDAIQFVDQHGNPAGEILPGHPISFPVRNEVFPIHNALDVHPDFADGEDQMKMMINSRRNSPETDT